MNDWIAYIYFSISGAALLLSLMGLWFTAIIPGIDRWSKRFFMSYFLIFLLCWLSCNAERAFQNHIVPGTAFYLLILLENLLLSLPLPMLTVFLLHCCGENLRSSKLLRSVLALWAILLIVLASAAFIEGFFYVTRGDLPPPFPALFKDQKSKRSGRWVVGNRK